MSAVDDILAERQHQLEIGFDAGHDDHHADGELAWAASYYATSGAAFRLDPEGHGAECCSCYPWGDPGINLPADPCDSRREELVRAAALLIAEIERLDRLNEPEE